MENFNSSLKREIASLDFENQKLALSRLSAIIKTGGEIHYSNNCYYVMIRTELIELFDAINKILSSIYNASASLEIAEDVGFKDKPKYEITLPKEITKQILLDTEVAYYDEVHNFCFNSGISQYVIENEKECIEYLRGVYLVSGTSNVVLSNENKKLTKNSGYQIEFAFFNETLASDFSILLADLGVISKSVNKKDKVVVYAQHFDQVCLLIGIMGATKSFLALQNENAYREVRNNINRQNNCISGNIGKVVNASISQLDDIKILQEKLGLENLDKPLQDACYLRLANPEESLDNLVKLSTEKITKSGLYHRFKKLEKLAKELKK